MNTRTTGPADDRPPEIGSPPGTAPQTAVDADLPAAPGDGDWPDLEPDAAVIPVRRRPVWLVVVSLILVLNGVTHLLFSQVAADQLLAPEAGIVGVVALVAAVGVFLAMTWGRLLAGGLAIYWLAQTAALTWAWLMGGTPSGDSGSSGPVLDLILPTVVYLSILILVGLRWPDRTAR